MDRISKGWRKLAKKLRIALLADFKKVLAGNIDGVNIKKLKNIMIFIEYDMVRRG